MVHVQNVYSNEEVEKLLGCSTSTLKKLRSLLVNTFHLMNKGDKISDTLLKVLRDAHLYVQDHPGTSYETGIKKSLEAKSEIVEAKLSAKEKEELENYEVLNAYTKGLFGSFVNAAVALTDIANEFEKDYICKLLNATVDTYANIVGNEIRKKVKYTSE